MAVFKLNRYNGDKVSLVFDKLKINNNMYAWDPTEDKRVPVKQTKNTFSKSHGGPAE